MFKFQLYKKYYKRMIKKKMRLYLFLAIVVFLFTIPSKLIYSFGNLPQKPPIIREINLNVPKPAAYPVNKTGVENPYLSARSVIVVDPATKAVIYMYNPDEKLSPASTTKMVTGLVASQIYNPEDVVTVENPERIGQVMELYKDEQITVKALLYGLLVKSGNDAAYALADFHQRGRGAFVNEMNNYVKNLGLKDTNFANPAGIDNGKHYSTVHDLALIGAEIINHPMLAEIVGTKDFMVTDITGEFMHSLESTNELLGVVEGLRGIKTGWTDSAGDCLVTYTERNGHGVLTAMLGSYDRFGETQKIIEWVYANFEWVDIDVSGIDW